MDNNYVYIDNLDNGKVAICLLVHPPSGETKFFTEEGDLKKPYFFGNQIKHFLFSVMCVIIS